MDFDVEIGHELFRFYYMTSNEPSLAIRLKFPRAYQIYRGLCRNADQRAVAYLSR